MLVLIRRSDEIVLAQFWAGCLHHFSTGHHWPHSLPFWKQYYHAGHDNIVFSVSRYSNCLITYVCMSHNSPRKYLLRLIDAVMKSDTAIIDLVQILDILRGTFRIWTAFTIHCVHNLLFYFDCWKSQKCRAGSCLTFARYEWTSCRVQYQWYKTIAKIQF